MLCAANYRILGMMILLAAFTFWCAEPAPVSAQAGKVPGCCQFPGGANQQQLLQMQPMFNPLLQVGQDFLQGGAGKGKGKGKGQAGNDLLQGGAGKGKGKGQGGNDLLQGGAGKGKGKGKGQAGNDLLQGGAGKGKGKGKK